MSWKCLTLLKKGLVLSISILACMSLSCQESSYNTTLKLSKVKVYDESDSKPW